MDWELTAEEVELIKKNQLVQAIRLIRNRLSISLGHARNLIDRYQPKMTCPPPPLNEWPRRRQDIGPYIPGERLQVIKTGEVGTVVGAILELGNRSMNVYHLRFPDSFGTDTRVFVEEELRPPHLAPSLERVDQRLPEEEI